VAVRRVLEKDWLAGGHRRSQNRSPRRKKTPLKARTRSGSKVSPNGGRILQFRTQYLPAAAAEKIFPAPLNASICRRGRQSPCSMKRGARFERESFCPAALQTPQCARAAAWLSSGRRRAAAKIPDVPAEHALRTGLEKRRDGGRSGAGNMAWHHDEFPPAQASRRLVGDEARGDRRGPAAIRQITRASRPGKGKALPHKQGSKQPQGSLASRRSHTTILKRTRHGDRGGVPQNSR